MATPSTPVEMSWFAPLCDDDYEFLGIADPRLLSSYEHARGVALMAEEFGFDNMLLPSSYAIGIDNTAFAAGVAPFLRRMRLLLAARCGELHPAQLARQMATIDQMLGGRLTINIISSEMPGETLDSKPRYQRTKEVMDILRALLDGESVDHRGEIYTLKIDPPRIRTVSGRCPPFYFGGHSPDALDAAAYGADVYLMWPDTMDRIAANIADVKARAAAYGRSLKVGYRAHVIVRETEAEARDAAERLVSRVDPATGEAIRAKALDSQSVGVRRQAELRTLSRDDGYIEENLWTGVGRARSGAGAAIVGDPDQVLAKLEAYKALGIEAFILSGYPSTRELDLFGRHVLPRIAHAPL